MSESSASNQDLSPDVLHWVRRAVGTGATIRSVSPMGGATSSTLHAISVEYRGGPLELVLRRFTNEEWLREEPDLARHEAAALRIAAGAGVPTPELIGYDEHGRECGVPAILMTRLPGHVELLPADLDGWLSGLAAAIIPFHSLEIGDYPWCYSPYNAVSRLQVPGWSSVPDLWARAIQIVQGPWPATHTCFIHRDYHPTNVLWQDGQVSGVIDWPNACRGPEGIDPAWCRANLVGLYGVAAADRFLHHYEALAGSSFEYDPFWDLMVIIEDCLPEQPGIYSPWIEYGVRGLTDELMRERDAAYLSSVLARF